MREHWSFVVDHVSHPYNKTVTILATLKCQAAFNNLYIYYIYTIYFYI